MKLIQQLTAAGTAHTNTTVENKVGRKIFAAGELLPGKIFQVQGVARVTASDSTDTVTMALRWGTTSATPASNTLVATSAAVDAVNDDVSIFKAVIEVQTATRIVIHGVLSDCDAQGSKLVNEFSSIITYAADTLYYFDFTADWSVATASNSIQAEAFSVLEVV